jgi:hypothetical protein
MIKQYNQFFKGRKRCRRGKREADLAYLIQQVGPGVFLASSLPLPGSLMRDLLATGYQCFILFSRRSTADCYLRLIAGSAARK